MTLCPRGTALLGASSSSWFPAFMPRRISTWGGGPRCQAVPGFADDQECLQVQRWSAEQLGKATDEELWEASLCVVLKVHQFFATETARQGMVVFQKGCSI